MTVSSKLLYSLWQHDNPNFHVLLFKSKVSLSGRIAGCLWLWVRLENLVNYLGWAIGQTALTRQQVFPAFSTALWLDTKLKWLRVQESREVAVSKLSSGDIRSKEHRVMYRVAVNKYCSRVSAYAIYDQSPLALIIRRPRVKAPHVLWSSSLPFHGIPAWDRCIVFSKATAIDYEVKDLTLWRTKTGPAEL